MQTTKGNGEARRGDVYWADVPNAAGVHMNRGMRPFIIVSCNISNRYSKNVTAVPCTTRRKAKIQSHAYVEANGRCNVAQCEQIQTFGAEYLGNFICRLSAEDMEKVNLALRIHLGLWKSDDKD